MTLDGVLVTVETTDLNGNFGFANLPPGNYVVFVTDSNGELTGLGLTTGNEPLPVTVAAGENFTDADFGYEPGPVSIVKSLLPVDELANTIPDDVAIGEIITYEIRVTFGAGAEHVDAMITDLLDFGLAFMDCNPADISADAGLTTDLAGGFADLCTPQSPPLNLTGNPAISEFPTGSVLPEEAGRQLVWNLGTVENTAGAEQTLTIIYRVIVLDIASNVRGVTLNNDAYWGSGVGNSSAAPVTIVEPTLDIRKDASVDVAAPGDLITFRLTIFHTPASNSDAFETIVNDAIEPEFTYVAGSLRYVSGQVPTLLNDAGAPNLQIVWDEFLENGVNSVIEFDVILGVIPPGGSASNTGFVEWTSFPGDRTAPQSPWNIYSTERWYDPPDPVNIYGGISSTSIIQFPTELAAQRGVILPASGFPPDRQSVISPPQGIEYTQLGDLWLEIPSLGVQAPIVGVPFSGAGWAVDYLYSQAGYLEGSAYPTLPGNSALAGHVWNADGTPGIFQQLKSLQYGQLVILHANGLTYTYEIRSNGYVRPDDFSVLREEEFDWLTLITCEAFNEETGEYDLRVVARAVLISVGP